MSNSTEQTLEEEPKPLPSLQNPNTIDNQQQQLDQSQEWETMAQAWIRAFPEGKAVNGSQVETWIDSNFSSLPADLQSMPRSEVIDRLLSIQHHIKLPNQDKKTSSQVEPPARFQRTNQWIPVYAWLESLNREEVVKSKDISDWLAENPEIKDQLCSRHSRYHLMHYIKKCHLKLLKRKEKKGLQQSSKVFAFPNKETSLMVQKSIVTKQITPIPSNPLNNIPKDSDLYIAKRNEALHKFGILVELEKKLSPVFSKPQDVVVNK